MSDQEERIKLEMRLSAIEYMLSKIWVALMRSSRPTSAQIDAAYAEFLASAAKQRFPGLDPAMSDHASAEWTEAVERLVAFQKEMMAQP